MALTARQKRKRFSPKAIELDRLTTRKGELHMAIENMAFCGFDTDNGEDIAAYDRYYAELELVESQISAL